jgi:hypothetical protein
VTGFDVEGVTRNGRAEPWRLEKRANGVRIWIGDPAVEIGPGEHTYTIAYASDRQLGYFPDHDELYWNVTGNGWTFPIDEVSATVTLPAEVPADVIGVEAYTGPQGAKGRHLPHDARARTWRRIHDRRDLAQGPRDTAGRRAARGLPVPRRVARAARGRRARAAARLLLACLARRRT